jgi:Icc-related predicted phosphoesterase
MLHIPRQHGRILVLGDLHLDFWQEFGRFPLERIDLANLDALIVAGDLTNKPKTRWSVAIEVLAGLLDRSRIVILPGNHDYYNFRLDGDARLKQIAEDAGVHFAQKRVVEIGELRLLLCTLWTDFEAGGNYWKNTAAASEQMNDYRYIRLAAAKFRKLRPQDTKQVHIDHRVWLETELKKPWPGRTGVVTHHAPLVEAARADDGLAACYASDLRDLISETQPEFWLFGHTHRDFETSVGQTRVANVSLGYPDEVDFSDNPVMRRIIEI